MKQAKSILVTVICLWMAGGCQQSLAPHMAIYRAWPDFLLVNVACLSLFTTRAGGTLLGFAGGVIHGALAGVNLAAYAITRTLAGFMVGWLNSLEFDANVFVAFMATAGASLFAQLVLMFVAPPEAILPFLGATIASAMYNGVIAMPVYALLKRILDPPVR